MSDPTRLLSGEGSDFEKELLGSWGEVQPSDAARARALAIVGAAAGAAGTATAVAKAGVAAGSSIAPKAGAVGAAALLKWLFVGAFGVATAGATLAYVHRARQRAAPAAAVAPAVSPAEPVVKAPAPPAATSTSALAAPVAPEAPTRSAPPVRRPSEPPGRRPGETAARGADDALGDQVSALDHARRALADGDAAGALRRLDEYEARFPRGALVEEAEVLRVESLLAENDRAAAARVGARFLASHPGSPHAARVRSLLAPAPGP